MLLRAASLVALLTLLGCSSSGREGAQREPAGTPTDPVEVCTRVADVCRLDGAKLGVCVAPPPGPPPAACDGRDPCYLCMSQH